MSLVCPQSLSGGRQASDGSGWGVPRPDQPVARRQWGGPDAWRLGELERARVFVSDITYPRVERLKHAGVETLSEPGSGSRPAAWYNASVATFLVVNLRAGPEWDPSRPLEEQSGWPAHASFMDGLVESGFIVLGGPLADEHRVPLVVEAESEDVVRATLAQDPWSETHLRIGSIDPWTIRLDGRRA